MKIRDKLGLKALDERTMLHQNLRSIDLMERAAKKVTSLLIHEIKPGEPIQVVCGPGNNGGDGLAIARMLHQLGYPVTTYLADLGKTLSGDTIQNLDALQQLESPVLFLRETESLPEFKKGVILDCLTGFGFKQPAGMFLKKLITWINDSDCRVYAVDLPSGLAEAMEVAESAPVVRAYKTYTFHSPKASFFPEEHAEWVGDWEIVDIGLWDEEKTASTDCPYWVEKSDIRNWFNWKRPRHSYKNQFGHLGIIAGSRNMGGACLLNAGAALKSGVGLVTVFSISEMGSTIRQKYPSCMFETLGTNAWIEGAADFSRFDAVVIGSGIGFHEATHEVVHSLLKTYPGKIVMDGDALTILANHPEWYSLLSSRVILTPHPGEFRRLAGNFTQGAEKFELAKKFSFIHSCTLNLKGGYSTVFGPDGRIGINSTGNPGMAKGGSGDVLAGLIGGLCARGLPPWEAAVTGNLLHGQAGDLASSAQGMESMDASDLITHLPVAFQLILG